MTKDRIFEGAVVNVGIDAKIPQKEYAGVTPQEATEIHTGRVAESLATFLTKHFLVVGYEENGDIKLSINLSLLTSTPPKGVAHRRILFMDKPTEENPDAN